MGAGAPVGTATETEAAEKAKAAVSPHSGWRLPGASHRGRESIATRIVPLTRGRVKMRAGSPRNEEVRGAAACSPTLRRLLVRARHARN